MNHPLANDLDHVLAHTSGIWEDLREARIFVTGGTGFFGCWLAESFVWACDRLSLKATMTVLTRSPRAFRLKAPHLASHPAIRLVEGDVRSFQTPEPRYTHVIHGATDASAVLIRERPLLMIDTIVDGTRRVLDFAVAAQARRFLFTSSGAVYGPQPQSITHVPESYTGGPDVSDPQAAYAEGKRLAELLCAIYARQHRMHCVIARGFAFVGPYLSLSSHFAIGNFIRDCLSGQPIQVRGDGTPFRSYLYAADLAVWLWTMLVRGESVRPYNLGSENALPIAEVAAAVALALNPQNEIRIAAMPRPGVPAERYIPSTARVRGELGLGEHVPLQEAIQRTADWCVRTETVR
ncbi:MAG TPA: NAD-dependent epimerase/dehydratase family protein [Bryobacteraceae bacterium]|nr:NAD-dependent epimerase/dehydratase family protein [Bryobacteraceae bacterium]